MSCVRFRVFFIPFEDAFLINAANEFLPKPLNEGLRFENKSQSFYNKHESTKCWNYLLILIN